MLGKINFLTALAALVLFFLPWIDIRCSNQSIATQTGIQTIYGGSTPSEQLKPRSSQVRAELKEDKSKDSLGTAPLVGVAAAYVVGAVILSFLALRSGSKRSELIAGILCAMALALIGLQMAVGFPARRNSLNPSPAQPPSRPASMARPGSIPASPPPRCSMSRRRHSLPSTSNLPPSVSPR
ncbi:MAG: hypothetical protein QM755_24660 [Luteolibacter sp.]